MQRALDKGADIYGRYIFDQRSALHYAAQCQGEAGPGAVRWLLDKGIPWSAKDCENEIPEDVALKHQENLRFLIRPTSPISRGGKIISKISEN